MSQKINCEKGLTYNASCEDGCGTQQHYDYRGKNYLQSDCYTVGHDS